MGVDKGTCSGHSCLPGDFCCLAQAFNISALCSDGNERRHFFKVSHGMVHTENEASGDSGPAIAASLEVAGSGGSLLLVLK